MSNLINIAKSFSPVLIIYYYTVESLNENKIMKCHYISMTGKMEIFAIEPFAMEPGGPGS
jgi:hypothetical protein